MIPRRYGSTDTFPDEDQQQLAALPRRVIVKFRDQQESPAQVAGLEAADPVAQVREAFPDYTVVPVVTEVDPGELDRMYHDALADGAPPRTGNLRNFVAVELPSGSDPSQVVTRASDISGVEFAYPEPEPAPPPVAPADDPRSANQGYLNAAPGGIDARFAWGKPGGDGAGIGLVDLEQGWVLNHEDLVAQNIQLISGSNALFRDHGTAVLGEMCMTDNALGGIGAVPSATVRVVSQHQTGGYSTAGAIASAANAMSAGDVLLLEAQTTWNGAFHPVEIDAAVFSAIRQAVARGIVVVEAGGNGSVDLDNATDASGRFVLNRGHPDFQDSGAILVGAASSSAPHTVLGFSNHGSRIDCFGWGENIDTTDTTAANPTGAYRPDTATGRSPFSGTSGASPIVTSAAVALQGMTVGRGRTRLTPARVREILSDRACNTPSANPGADGIGVMPDLHAIWDNYVDLGRSAPGDYPMPTDSNVAYAGRQRVACLDAGHGGNADRGKSAALGSGGSEKDFNLRLAQSVRRQLGNTAALTREGDYNLSLAERAAAARQSGAPVFVSLHGASDGGSHVWVYGNGRGAAAGSRALAQAVRDELSRMGRAVDVREGELAVLHPAYHRPQTAACLVEAPQSAPQVDALGAAIARGVRRYLGSR